MKKTIHNEDTQRVSAEFKAKVARERSPVSGLYKLAMKHQLYPNQIMQ